ncbi:ComEC/Rec2 family competence protein, partial [Streptomyces sp. NPDC093589]|uniref:ComEC/Rec2 family competence protein n=1 Tax=Streptomyces sp. NPDC093589 TaxID=3366043 RepID=UPI0038056222
ASPNSAPGKGEPHHRLTPRNRRLVRHAHREERVHADHVDGLPGVLRGRAVGAIETTTLQEPAGQAEFVHGKAAAAGVPVIRAAPGERRHLGPLTWEVLWPPAPEPTTPGAPEPTTPGSPGSALPPPADHGPNDASVTLLVHTGGLTLLLLGDLEPPAQQALLAAHPELGPVDVLKVAHHGSGYQDPGLLRRVAPRLALISTGADNPYGHPAPRTVTALRAQGAQVLRTDTDGALAVLGTPDRLSTTTRGHRSGSRPAPHRPMARRPTARRPTGPRTLTGPSPPRPSPPRRRRSGPGGRTRVRDPPLAASGSGADSRHIDSGR